VVANIFGAIGQGLGAFGASLNHTENFAFKYVQSQIQADIAQQQAEYEAGRADRNNALARFVNYYHGDMDMAKAAMLQAQNKVAETETQAFAAQAQSKDISANAQVLAAQFGQQQLLAEQQRAELAQGKTTITSEDKFHQASGGGDGSKPLTLEQQLAIRKGVTGKPAKDQGALGLTAQGVARQKANYGTKNEQIERANASFEDEAKLMGLAVDRDTGTLVDPKTGKPARGPEKSPGVGYVAGHVPDFLTGEEGRAARRARMNSARLHAQAIYDKSITADEAEHEVPTIMGKNPEDWFNSLKQRVHELHQYKRELDTTAASIDPRIVNERDSARRAVNLARATGKPLPGPQAQLGSDNGDTANESDCGP